MRVAISTQRRRGAESGVATYVRLEDVCEILIGNSAPQEASCFEGGTYPFVRTSDVGGIHFGILNRSRDLLNNTGIKGMRLFRKGSILFPKSGASAFLNHRVMLGIDAFVSSHLAVVEASGKVDANYLLHYLMTVDTKNLLQNSAYPSLRRGDIAAIPIPLPPLAEQRRIAVKLDRLCDVVAKRKRQLVQLQQLVKSRFVEMFGDLNGSSFPRSTIGEVCEVKSGGTPDRKVREYWENGDIPWVKTTELKNCELYDSEEHITTLAMNESSAKLVPPETILLAMYGQGRTRGMTAKLKIAATTNQACACILPGGKIDQDYLWHYLVLSYEKIRALAQGAGQPNLNGKMIRSFGVPLPPLALQREFAAFVAKVDKLAFAVRKCLELVEKLYRQQLSEAFA